MKESLRSQTPRPGNQASRAQPSGMSATTTQDSHARRPKSPSRVEDLVFDEAGKNLLSSDKGYAAAKAAQAAQRAQATSQSRPLPQGTSAATRVEKSGYPATRPAPSNVSQNSNSGKVPKAYRDPNPSHIINEGPPMWSQPVPDPFKSSPWNSAKIALFGEDSLYVDNGKDNWSDKNAARQLAREARARDARKTTSRETRDRSNSITSILSEIKSGLKAAFGSSASLGSMRSGKSSKSPPPNPLYPHLDKKDWEEYYARSAKLKAKISKPMPNGPIFEYDHIVAQQNHHEQWKQTQRSKQSRTKTEPRRNPSNVTIKTDEMKSFKEMKASPAGYIKHNDFQKHNHRPSIAREVIRPHTDFKLSFDKALENLHLKHKDSDESFSNSPAPPQLELQRVCNGCGRPLKKHAMDQYYASMCDYCADKQKCGERKPIDTRPTNKDRAKTKPPISPAIDDGEVDEWAGRPISDMTESYDETDISTLRPPDTILQKRVLIHPSSEDHSTNPEDRYSIVTTDLSSLLPPDTIMQKRVLIHPASKNHATDPEDRYSAVPMDLSSLLPPETLTIAPRPLDAKKGSLRRNPSERIYQKPQHTKSAFLHDMGNPFDRQTMVATPPVPALPPPLPPKIPLKALPGSNSTSAPEAVRAGRPSPLSLLTQENRAKWEAMKPDPNFAIPQIPNDIITDDARDTRFCDFYDDVLKTDSEKGSPPKRRGTGKARR